MANPGRLHPHRTSPHIAHNRATQTSSRLFISSLTGIQTPRTFADDRAYNPPLPCAASSVGAWGSVVEPLPYHRRVMETLHAVPTHPLAPPRIRLRGLPKSRPARCFRTLFPTLARAPPAPRFTTSKHSHTCAALRHRLRQPLHPAHRHPLNRSTHHPQRIRAF